MQAKKINRAKIKNSCSEAALFFIFIAALFFLISCSEKAEVPAPVQPKAQEDSKKNTVEKQKNDPSVQIAQETYSYNPNGKVDPFTPVIAEGIEDESPQKSANVKKTAQEVPLTPLQKLDVNDFMLVAVISTPKGLAALLEDPAMNGFIIKEGMRIGRNSGVIRKILNTSVLIEEQNVESKGSTEKKIITLTLRKK
jgi:Tfp pilus assembly protein PilP